MKEFAVGFSALDMWLEVSTALVRPVLAFSVSSTLLCAASSFDTFFAVVFGTMQDLVTLYLLWLQPVGAVFPV